MKKHAEVPISHILPTLEQEIPFDKVKFKALLKFFSRCIQDENTDQFKSILGSTMAGLSSCRLLDLINTIDKSTETDWEKDPIFYFAIAQVIIERRQGVKEPVNISKKSDN